MFPQIANSLFQTSPDQFYQQFNQQNQLYNQQNQQQLYNQQNQQQLYNQQNQFPQNQQQFPNGNPFFPQQQYGNYQNQPGMNNPQIDPNVNNLNAANLNPNQYNYQTNGLNGNNPNGLNPNQPVNNGNNPNGPNPNQPVNNGQTNPIINKQPDTSPEDQNSINERNQHLSNQTDFSYQPANGGAIAGIVIGVLLGALALGFGIYYILSKRTSNNGGVVNSLKSFKNTDPYDRDEVDHSVSDESQYLEEGYAPNAVQKPGVVYTPLSRPVSSSSRNDEESIDQRESSFRMSQILNDAKKQTKKTSPNHKPHVLDMERYFK
jgi:hypothetical protein